MILERTLFERDTHADTDIQDLTPEIHSFLESCPIQSGQLLVFTPGSTAGITTIEFESGAVNDLKRAIDRIAPTASEYEHNIRWGDGNGYSHVRAALLGPSLTVPIEEGHLLLGTWQQIVLCDFDNRPRRRKIILQLLGE